MRVSSLCLILSAALTTSAQIQKPILESQSDVDTKSFLLKDIYLSIDPVTKRTRCCPIGSRYDGTQCALYDCPIGKVPNNRGGCDYASPCKPGEFPDENGNCKAPPDCSHFGGGYWRNPSTGDCEPVPYIPGEQLCILPCPPANGLP
ncbi:hypothetical protein BDV27DRAFT_121030 [Aspergillus caelatus]|uniref:Uncharacterized protein n=1 Tax=Aspergillus caelatus TaxID=61420 RepID=A0A5N7AJS4_9EURO|nr:uncharacterized protein BDV27DRAFT_121030 [Aspergillus caelatus]KAE8369259.1 hypothetical protein BDV27DRAFT_121030 [Aspergillus caelatus]